MATPAWTAGSLGNDDKSRCHRVYSSRSEDFYHIKPLYHRQHAIPPTAIAAAQPSYLGARLGHSAAWAMWRLTALATTAALMVLTLQGSAVMAAPQSCILCDKNDLIAKDPHSTFEEYLFEHQVTRLEAINALKQLNDSFYEGQQTDSSCMRCTDKVNNYCLGPQFINDHCLCEFGHSTEGLPFVPHICYVGEKIHKASVGSCYFYEEVKECCCSSLLAKEWRHISSAAGLHSSCATFYSSLIPVTVLLHLLMTSINC